MDTKTFGKHLIDIGKGALAAAAVSAGIAFVNYLGAHIPDILAMLGQIAAATVAVKAHNA